jgi:hypothetical protein
MLKRLAQNIIRIEEVFQIERKNVQSLISNQINKINLLHYNDGTATQISNEGIFHKMELERKRKRAIIREVLS